jgi:hypothetical protein
MSAVLLTAAGPMLAQQTEGGATQVVKLPMAQLAAGQVKPFPRPSLVLGTYGSSPAAGHGPATGPPPRKIMRRSCEDEGAPQLGLLVLAPAPGDHAAAGQEQQRLGPAGGMPPPPPRPAQPRQRELVLDLNQSMGWEGRPAQQRQEQQQAGQQGQQQQAADARPGVPGRLCNPELPINDLIISPLSAGPGTPAWEQLVAKCGRAEHLPPFFVVQGRGQPGACLAGPATPGELALLGLRGARALLACLAPRSRGRLLRCCRRCCRLTRARGVTRRRRRPASAAAAA